MATRKPPVPAERFRRLAKPPRLWRQPPMRRVKDVSFSKVAPLGLSYLRILTFILVIAAVVQFTEMVIRKMSPGLYQSLGIYLPLITTNCAVLGVALLNISQQFGLFKSLVYGFGSAMGFTLVMVIFAGLRERVALSRVPQAFDGAPIAFVTISLLALAFMGFSGLNI